MYLHEAYIKITYICTLIFSYLLHLSAINFLQQIKYFTYYFPFTQALYLKKRPKKIDRSQRDSELAGI